jgi:hypothetical protein
LTSTCDTPVPLSLAVMFGDVVLVPELVILIAPPGIEVCSPGLIAAVDTATGAELVAEATDVAEIEYTFVYSVYILVVVDP